MPYLFCNVGWMEYYKGQTPGDRIKGGGSYITKEGRGHEVCNFAPYSDKVYGYVRPAGKQIKIERLGTDADAETISNVTVIWTARHPKGGTVIVGWYKGAIVHRHYANFSDSPSLHKKNGIDGYWIEDKSSNATLLPIDERTFEIPRGKGGMGQSNVCYANPHEHKSLLEEIEKFIGRKKVTAKSQRSRKTDPEKKAEVEKAAIRKTTEYFESIGYTIDSVEKDNRGWDLEAISGKKKLLIEVKGLSGNELSVELTPNEYAALSDSDKKDNYRLCVVSTALTYPRLFVCRYSKEAGKWVVEGKNTAIIDIKPKQSASIEIKI